MLPNLYVTPGATTSAVAGNIWRLYPISLAVLYRRPGVGSRVDSLSRPQAETYSQKKHQLYLSFSAAADFSRLAVFSLPRLKKADSRSLKQNPTPLAYLFPPLLAGSEKSDRPKKEGAFRLRPPQNQLSCGKT
jgi:hypothetical protein